MKLSVEVRTTQVSGYFINVECQWGLEKYIVLKFNLSFMSTIPPLYSQSWVLVQAVVKYSTSNILGHSWIEVSWEMPGRLPQQCQERYMLADVLSQLTFVFLCVTFRAPCVSPLIPSESDTSLEHTHPMTMSSHSSPCSRYSLSYTHKFMVFFRNRTVLPVTSAIPTTFSVSDNIVAFTPSPTPHSRCSLTHTHKFMGFLRNRTTMGFFRNRTVNMGFFRNRTVNSLAKADDSRWASKNKRRINSSYNRLVVSMGKGMKAMGSGRFK